MSQPVVFDASAILAFLQGEPGGDMVARALQGNDCLVSAANLAEVIAKSVDRGVTQDALQMILRELALTVVEIKPEDGAVAGWMRAETRALGLSLGDRLCLALAQRLKAQVLTADRPWVGLAAVLVLDIVCIRPDAH